MRTCTLQRRRVLDKYTGVRMEQRHWTKLVAEAKAESRDGSFVSASDLIRRAIVAYWKLPTNGETKE